MKIRCRCLTPSRAVLTLARGVGRHRNFSWGVWEAGERQGAGRNTRYQYVKQAGTIHVPSHPLPSHRKKRKQPQHVPRPCSWGSLLPRREFKQVINRMEKDGLKCKKSPRLMLRDVPIFWRFPGIIAWPGTVQHCMVLHEMALHGIA